MVMSRRSRTSRGPPSPLAVSTTRAAGSGRNRPSVLTSLVGSVTQASTSTARCVGPDDCTVTEPPRPSGTRARLDDVEPAAGTVTVVASGRAHPWATPSPGPAARRRWRSVAGPPLRPRPAGGRPPRSRRSAAGRASWSRGGVEDTLSARPSTNRPSAAPVALGRNQPSTSRLAVASTVDDRATAPSTPTGTITKPLPVSPAAARSTVAVVRHPTGRRRDRHLASSPGAGHGDAEGDGAHPGRRHPGLAEHRDGDRLARRHRPRPHRRRRGGHDPGRLAGHDRVGLQRARSRQRGGRRRQGGGYLDRRGVVGPVHRWVGRSPAGRVV